MKVRSLPGLAVAVAALLLPAVATAKPAGTVFSDVPLSPLGGLSVGGFVGYETDDVGGLSLRADGEVPIQALTPQIGLSAVASLGFSHLTRSESVLGVTSRTTANVLKLVPAARFTLPVNPLLSVFGDAGLGVYYVSLTGKVTGFPTETDSRFAVMMRLAAGGWYHVSPDLRVGAALELDPMFGDFDQQTWIFQVGAMFRI